MSAGRREWTPTRYDLKDDSGMYARVEKRGPRWTWDLFDANSMQTATGNATSPSAAKGAAGKALDAAKAVTK